MNEKQISTYQEEAIFKYIVTVLKISKADDFTDIYNKLTKDFDNTRFEEYNIPYVPKKHINQPYVSRMFEKFQIIKDKKKKAYVVDSKSNLLDIQKQLANALSKIPIRSHNIIKMPNEETIREMINEETNEKTNEKTNEEKEGQGIYILTIDVPLGAERYVADILYSILSSNQGKDDNDTSFNSIIPGFRSVSIICEYEANIYFIYGAIKKVEQSSVLESEDYFDTHYTEDDVKDIMKDDIQAIMYEILAAKANKIKDEFSDYAWD